MTLLNDGRALKYAITTRPEDKDWRTNLLNRQTLHIFNIPAEEFPNETLVLKIELDNDKIKI